MSKFEFSTETVFEEKPVESKAAGFDAFAEKEVDLADAAELEARRRAELNEAKWRESAQTLIGTEKAEELDIQAGTALIVGGGGDDTIRAVAGDDRIYGGKGSESVFAGAGNDIVWTAEDDDRLFGEDGDDLLGGDEGDDTLEGGAGNDTLWGWTGDDYLAGGDGDDILGGDAGYRDRMFGGDGNDSIFDFDGVNGAHGGAGDDLISIVFAAGWDNDANARSAPRSDGKISGGAGDDEIFVAMDHPGFFINLRADDIAGAASDGDDYVELSGRYANAVVSMGGGDDYFKGGAGGDNVNGGAGHDWIDGGAGNDRLTGGEGWDRFVFSDGSGRDTIVDFQDGIDVVDLSGYRGAKGEGLAFADLKISASGRDAIVSLPGGETIAFSNLSSVLLERTDFVF
jgi:Ca2+-binding RTX toxin-like protein